jgi:alcohol dehydrogenase
MKQIEFFGMNSIENLKDILIKERSNKVFLVTGKNSFESCGAKKKLEELLKDKQITRFYNFSSNPKLEEIKKGYEIFQQDKYDLIIGIGGGSSIDVAKSIKLFHFNDSKKNLPLIAIPTTAGSGSEATYFIVYYEKKEKQSKGHQNITLPNYSICDSQFIINLPKKIAATSGIDALAQAMESYWAIGATLKSQIYAKKAIELTLDNLELAINSDSKKAKEMMLKAANFAGKAINISKTTASHALSYGITSRYDIPHGHAVGLTLGKILIYNSNISEKDCLDKRGADYVINTIENLVKLTKSSNIYELDKKIKEIMENIGLETTFNDLNINNYDFLIDFNLERARNNPRKITIENLKKILENTL